MQAKQEQLFKKEQTLVSIDKSKNRFRAYQVELDKSQAKPKITKRWGRVEEKKGGYVLRNNKWLGEKEEAVPDDLDEFDSEDVWNQIIEMKKKRGYVDYSELIFS